MKSYSVLVKYKRDTEKLGLRMTDRIPMVRTRYLMEEGELKPYFDTLLIVDLCTSLESIYRGLHIKWLSRGYN